MVYVPPAMVAVYRLCSLALLIPRASEMHSAPETIGGCSMVDSTLGLVIQEVLSAANYELLNFYYV